MLGLIKRAFILPFMFWVSVTLLMGQATLVKDAGCDNYLHISGASNINEFSFTYVGTNSGNGGVPARDNEKIEISIPIKEFEASEPMMYGDFLDLMKASEYPRIRISFSKQQLQNALQDITQPCPEIDITIAGITRTYSVRCSLAKCADRLYLRGEEIVKLSDFNLKPPAKLLGLVKVNDEINVDFGFIITFTDNNTFSATL
jgi:hypothetical protein